MNAVHQTKFEHAYVLDVHFSMEQKTNDSNDSDSDVTATTCLMMLHINVQQSPGSYFAVVDSGTSMHILQDRLFTSNLSEDHTAVSGFSGNKSRPTHRGDFNCVVRTQNGRLIHLVDPSAVLVIPDSHKNLYSVRHAQLAGHTVILGAQAGLLPYGDPKLFVLFLEDKSTGLWFLPLLTPPQTYNGVYPIYNAELVTIIRTRPKK